MPITDGNICDQGCQSRNTLPAKADSMAKIDAIILYRCSYRHSRACQRAGNNQRRLSYNKMQHRALSVDHKTVGSP